MKRKEIHESTSGRQSLHSHRTLHIPFAFDSAVWANTLTIFLPYGASPSNNATTHVNVPVIFVRYLPNLNFFDKTAIKSLSITYNNSLSTAETSCFTRTGKLTDKHDETNGSFPRNNKNPYEIPGR